MNIINFLRPLVLSAPLLIVAACAAGPDAVETDFGNSVRHMQEAQTANPTAPADSSPLDHGDGVRINAAIEAYRNGAADPKSVKDENLIGNSR